MWASSLIAAGGFIMRAEYGKRVGSYLRPARKHLLIARWRTPGFAAKPAHTARHVFWKATRDCSPSLPMSMPADLGGDNVCDRSLSLTGKRRHDHLTGLLVDRRRVARAGAGRALPRRAFCITSQHRQHDVRILRAGCAGSGEIWSDGWRGVRKHRS
jgi:hypothetical protein